MRWISRLIILLLGLALIGIYQYWTSVSVKEGDPAKCAAQGGGWDFANNSCDLKARENCIAQGYDWDQEGARCLVTDYAV